MNKIIITGLLCLLLLLTACSREQLPDASLSISPNTLKLKSNETSKDFVTITVTRNNEGNESVPFTVRFAEMSEVYPVDIETGLQITELTSRALKEKKQKDTLQFRVQTLQRIEPKYAEYEIPVTLEYAGTIVDSAKITVKVTYK